MRLKDFIDQQLVLVNVQAADKASLLEQLTDAVVSRHPQVDRDELLTQLQEREAQESTGIGNGIAVPHTVVGGLAQTVCALAQVAGGVDFEAIDKEPVYFVFLLLGPASGNHIRILARIARVVRNPEFLAEVRKAESPAVVYQLVLREDERHK